MTYVRAKLIRSDDSSLKNRRTLYKVYPRKIDRDWCLKILSRELPADCTELDVYVNGPERLLLPIIELCSLRQITLRVVYPKSEEDEEEYEYTPLLYSTCPICETRYAHAYSTCPQCGGYGYYLALPIEGNDLDEFLDDVTKDVKEPET